MKASQDSTAAPSAALSPAKQKLYALLKARRQAEERDTPAVTITPVDRGGPLPLSFSQQRMWFVDYMEPGNPAYNVPGALRFKGELSVAALAASLNQLIARHETLRTYFVAEGGQPRQAIRKSLHLRLPLIDLRRLPRSRREDWVNRLAVADNQRPYALASGPLLRAALVQLAADEHVLLLNMHHIIADNWTIGLFVQETAELYEACVEGRAPSLPVLHFHYADFAVWQRQQLAGPALESQLHYWLEALSGELPVLELPLDRPRPAVQGFRGARHYLDISPPTTAALRALARHEETTAFVVGLTVFNLLLHRFTGATDLPIGTTAAGRRHSGLESLLGLFMNLLVLRGDLRDTPSGRQLIKRLQSTTVAALTHQDVPFERVVDKLQVARDLSRTPIFQFQFNLQPASAETLERAGVVLTPLYVDSGTARFDMEMILWDHEGGLKGYMEYNVALFDATTMERLGRSFEALLGHLLQSPDAPIDRLVACSATEAQQLLWEHNDTIAPALILPSILPRIAAQAVRTPATDAVVFEDERLTYGELDRRADQVAHCLRQQGVGDETVVGICMERCPQLVVGLVGILRAGAAYLPLDPTHPVERLRWMIDDAGVRIALTTGQNLPELGVEVVALDREWKAIADHPAEGLTPSSTAASAAYVIYTSGSTGTPKGVVSVHGGLANRLLWMQERFGLTPHDRVLQKTAFTFDVSVWEFFWPLMYGATLVLARPDGHRDPSYLARLIAAEQITTLHFVPSMLRVFLETPEAAACVSLRRAILSGEALPSELALRFAELLPAAALHNLYGPTEASIDVTAWRHTPSAGEQAAPPRATVPIGRPIANTQIHVLDARLRPVPLGASGELCIGGAGLARGYLGRPALTARCFVPDPWREMRGARLYRTGDRVRRLASGEMEFLERLDHQVKVRGFRVELGEIESHVRSHPTVAEAVVVVEKQPPGGPALPTRLRACVVPSPQVEAADLATTLRAHLRARLPEAMVPAHFLVFDSLPQTSSGKIDRGALARASQRSTEDGADKVSASRHEAAARTAPRSETERLVAEIWKEILGVEAVGIDDRFFDIGGDSLLLAQVHSKLNDALGVALPMTVLFRHPTIRGLTDHLRQDGDEPNDHLSGAARARVRARARRDTGADIAIISMALRLPGADSPEAFWANLREGVESITFFTDEDCLAAGADPAMLAHPDYVRAEAILEGLELFDAPFFGITPREAELIDPQQRFLLELGWEALERGGYGAAHGRGAVGVFVGAAMSSYMFNNLAQFRAVNIMTDFQTRVSLFTGNEKDFHAQKMSYLLKLNGPSVNVQTACSSAVVAVHLGIQSLLAGECDMALAGGVQIRVPQKIGYLYQEGGLPSPDGHCRPFDAKAMGTLHSNGAGLVLIKRLDDALADGDPIHAVIRGSAVNNDADAKVGFTAPSLEGLARVAAEAQTVSGVDPATLGFLEAHGTGTDLGDTLEVEALTQVFRTSTDARAYCYMGSVKGNLGHLDTAAGIASLAKTALVLEHGEIPPTVHFEEPNPNIPFPSTPFKVNGSLVPWPQLETDTPRRAGVNVFAIGGTNVYMVLEEAPAGQVSGASRPWQLLPISARTSSALFRASRGLADWLQDDPASAEAETAATRLADVAFTLGLGRQAFGVRRMVLCQSPTDAVDALEDLEPPRVWSSQGAVARRSVVFAIARPGEAEEEALARLAASLYEREAVFRDAVDRIAEVAAELLDGDARALARCVESGAVENWQGRVPLARAARFAFTEALGHLWMAWGVDPELVVAVDDSAISHAAAAALSSRLELGAAITAALEDAPATEARENILDELFAHPERVVLEIGCGSSQLAVHPQRSAEQTIVAAAACDDGLALEAVPLAALAQLWTLGVEIDWSAFWAGQTRRRVRLPTYPFERQAYWIEAPKVGAQQEAEAATPGPASGQVYVPSWQRRPLVAASALRLEEATVLEAAVGLAADEVGLVLDDGSPLAAACAAALGQRWFCVSCGDTFSRSDDGFTLDPMRQEDYRTLVSALIGDGVRVRRVLHFWSLGDEGESEARGFWSLVHLARACAEGAADAPLEIGVVCTQTQEVSGDEPLSPARAAVLAPVRVLPQDLPQLSTWAVDIAGLPTEDAAVQRLVTRLVAELGRGARGSLVAYRGSYRWEEAWETLDGPPAVAPAAEARAYLFTDSGIGASLELAALMAHGDLAAGRPVKLAFLGPVLPEREEWSAHLEAHGDAHPASRWIAHFRALEERDAEIFLRRVELDDPSGLRAAVRACREAWGTIHGVVHAAVELGGPVPIPMLGDDAWQLSQARRRSAEILAEALDAENVSAELEFCLLISSLRGVEGTAGGAAAAAVDLSLDLFARLRTRAGAAVWRTVAWDDALLQRFASGEMATDEAATALVPYLSSPAEEIGRIVVARHHPRTPEAVQATATTAVNDAAGATGARRPRPALKTLHRAPTNALEGELITLWEELFGIEGLGIDDDFYELGGHSLMAVRMVSHLRDHLGVDLLLREALEIGTVRELAARVTTKQVAVAGDVDLDQLLDDLEGLSEEDARVLADSKGTA